MVITRAGAIVYCILAGFVALGSLASLSDTPGIRGYRNLSLLASYVLGIVSFFVMPLLWAVAIWAGAGVLTGLMYALYEVWSQARSPSTEEKQGFRVGHLIYGPLAWPLMFMEAVEYLHSELRGPKPLPPSGNP